MPQVPVGEHGRPNCRDTWMTLARSECLLCTVRPLEDYPSLPERGAILAVVPPPGPTLASDEQGHALTDTTPAHGVARGGCAGAGRVGWCSRRVRWRSACRWLPLLTPSDGTVRFLGIPRYDDGTVGCRSSDYRIGIMGGRSSNSHLRVSGKYCGDPHESGLGSPTHRGRCSCWQSSSGIACWIPL